MTAIGYTACALSLAINAYVLLRQWRLTRATKVGRLVVELDADDFAAKVRQIASAVVVQSSRNARSHLR